MDSGQTRGTISFILPCRDTRNVQGRERSYHCLRAEIAGGTKGHGIDQEPSAQDHRRLPHLVHHPNRCRIPIMRVHGIEHRDQPRVRERNGKVLGDTQLQRHICRL